MPTIAIINETSVLSDAQIAPVVQASQVYINRDLNKFWGLTAWLVQVFKGQPVPVGAWRILLRDLSDDDSAEGYHLEAPDGLPIAYSFPLTNMRDGVPWSVVFTHELAELRCDPWTTYSAHGVLNGQTVFRALESCDPCEDAMFAYKINDVLVSDFVTPKYFEDDSKTGPYDFAGHLTAPGQLLTNGYQSFFDVAANRWSDIAADHSPKYQPPFPGSRRWLRQKRHELKTKESQ